MLERYVLTLLYLCTVYNELLYMLYVYTYIIMIPKFRFHILSLRSSTRILQVQESGNNCTNRLDKLGSNSFILLLNLNTFHFNKYSFIPSNKIYKQNILHQSQITNISIHIKYFYQPQKIARTENSHAQTVIVLR